MPPPGAVCVCLGEGAGRLLLKGSSGGWAWRLSFDWSMVVRRQGTSVTSFDNLFGGQINQCLSMRPVLNHLCLSDRFLMSGL